MTFLTELEIAFANLEENFNVPTFPIEANDFIFL